MRSWKDLGVVETIYEEEHEEASTSPSLTPPPTSVYSYLQNKVDAWSLATGREADVSVHVCDRCFHLHKYPLSSRSSYMKRRLTESSIITLSPPLNITEETFAVIAYFCYSDELLVTPFNVAALRIAAEILEMTEANGSGKENIVRKTETYFCHAVAVNREYAAIVLRSCLALLPEAEKTAFLASRCIEALALTDGVKKVDGWVANVTALTAEEFQIIADSMKDRFVRNHDHLYKMVDLYLKEHASKLTDEEKNRICSTVDCNRLSQHLLIDAVQNYIMPLRFIVQAMLVEQLNTRRYVLPSTTSARRPHKPQDNDEAVTLGAILQRDAALRQVAQLKLLMDTTSSKIQGLERDLNGMKKQLMESEKKREELESVRSASFRFSRSDDKEVRGGLLSSEKSGDENSRNGRSFRKMWKGLKNVFRTSKRDSESQGSSGGDGDGDEEVVVVEESWPCHRRNHSLT